jgi:hypothetical protein
MIFGDRGIEVVVFRAVKNKLVEVSRSYVANAPSYMSRFSQESGNDG